MNQKMQEKILFVIAIVFLLGYLFFNDYLNIPDLVAGVVAGLYFLVLSILGLSRHRVYFTKTEPIVYKKSILAKVVNILFGIFGAIIIMLTLLVKM